MTNVDNAYIRIENNNSGNALEAIRRRALIDDRAESARQLLALGDDLNRERRATLSATTEIYNDHAGLDSDVRALTSTVRILRARPPNNANMGFMKTIAAVVLGTAVTIGVGWGIHEYFIKSAEPTPIAYSGNRAFYTDAKIDSHWKNFDGNLPANAEDVRVVITGSSLGMGANREYGVSPAAYSTLMAAYSKAQSADGTLYGPKKANKFFERFSTFHQDGELEGISVQDAEIGNKAAKGGLQSLIRG